MPQANRKTRALPLLALATLAGGGGCLTIPIQGQLGTNSNVFGRADVSARVAATLEGPVEIRVPTVTDPGPVLAMPVRAGQAADGPRVGLVDVDGLILNQNPTGPYSQGENPVSAFREKLEAAAADPRVRAVVVRINSPGGGVTACDILADELRRFRESTGKPVVACLMDLGTSGAYYLAVGGDRVIAHPTTVTGGIGAILNHDNLQDAMGQLGVVPRPVRSAPKVDMGTVLAPLDDETEAILKEMVDGFADRFRDRVARRRPAMTDDDWKAIEDGRVVTAPKALKLHMVDRIGYVHEAIEDAERLASVSQAEVVLFQRRGAPGRSLYAITPNAPIQGDLVPFSYPGLDRAKVPTFLYLWEADPTILRQGGR